MSVNNFFFGFKRGMHGFGQIIAGIINSILLLIVYFLGLGFTSIVAKLFKKRFIQKKFQNCNTYWTDLNLKDKPIEEYYHQF